MSATITYKGNTIANIANGGSKTMTTQGKYLEGNVLVTDTTQSGSATTPTGGITANPTISVSSSGLITASVSKSESITPIVVEGYVSGGTPGTVSFSGSNTSQLPTQAATTITPTTSEQIAVDAGKYTTGSIKVAAVPTGSATPAASISATGAGKVVGNGTITLSKSAVSNTPQVTEGYITSGTAGNTSVSLTASITTQAGQTIHPSTSDQTIAANTYVLGAQTFKGVTTSGLSASNIRSGVVVKIGDSTDDDCVTSVTGTANLYNWMGPEAELIETCYPVTQVALSTTSFNGWTPSTTAKTIKSGATVKTVNIDTENYEYYLVWDCDATIAYNPGTELSGAVTRQVVIIHQVICRRPGNLARVQSGTFGDNACITYYTAPLMLYTNTSKNASYSYSASYGIYPSATSATIGSQTAYSTTLTIKTPAWNARCNSSNFTTTMAEAVDQANSKYLMRGKLYRCKVGSPTREMYNNLFNLYLNPMSV